MAGTSRSTHFSNLSRVRLKTMLLKNDHSIIEENSVTVHPCGGLEWINLNFLIPRSSAHALQARLLPRDSLVFSP
ncbi:uncharacterized [Tachysurus ichikawai]